MGHLNGLLSDSGHLVPLVTYAALTSAAHHRVLVRSAALSTLALTEGAAMAAGRCFTTLLSERPVLREPRSTVHRVLEAGLLDELSPAWVMVAGRNSAARAHDLDELPVVVELEPENRWLTISIVDADGEQTISWANHGVDDERSEGPLVRSVGSECTL